ncbi:MAG: M24 family metallopeptidase [Gemmataceae bacterium]
MAMNDSDEIRSSQSLGEMLIAAPADRRADVDAKHGIITDLLKEHGCDGLLVLDPANFSWLTAGGVSRGVLDHESMPGLFFSQDGRWLLSSNVDSQRLFDEEIDGLGFQLKEWPWHLGRAQLVNDLVSGRNLACDTPIGESKLVGDRLAVLRRSMTDYDKSCYRALGQIVSHAVEAAGRTLMQGDTEREIAGQLSHRLLHRGATPVALTISADSRSRYYRQGSFTSTTVKNSCVLSVTARKYGLCATASRTVSFGPPENQIRREHDAACKVNATYVASSWPDSVPRQILASGLRHLSTHRRQMLMWYLASQGYVTGRQPVEWTFLPAHEDLLQPTWAVTWNVTVGAAVSCDTFLISDDGPRAITTAESWPLKRIRIQGAEFVRPDILVR